MRFKFRPVVLIVRDGWGRNPHAEQDGFNAVKLGKTPCGDRLLAGYPWGLIHTSGEDVGLPAGTMGNSEVGHQNLGAGRVVDQESVRITKAIRTGEFFTNEVLVGAVKRAKAAGRCVHLLGIASDAGVHGLLSHLYACLELCKRLGQEKVALHLFTDGRDTGPFTGKGFLEGIERECKRVGVGKIASVVGRYYAMDRDNRWQRVEEAYACLTGVRGERHVPVVAGSAVEAVERYYGRAKSETQKGDEFVTPTMIGGSVEAAAGERIRDGDTVIFYNYRGDRPRELVKAFTYDDGRWGSVPASPDTGQRGFARGVRPRLNFVTMTAYEEGLPVEAAFPKQGRMVDIGGEYLSRLGLRQFRCAETEKFPHVTFFFNDYREEAFAGESREVAQSPRVATYDVAPQMSAREVCGLVLKRLKAADCEDFILVNFANGDMVGHTGSLQATIRAVEVVDGCVGEIVEATLARGGALIVTADHGNAEQMFDPQTGSPHTAHTTYDVECIVVTPGGAGAGETIKVRGGGRLADVFPTVLELMGLEKPAAMTGRSLIG
jgi:2,3-bisphosphoglycerate-independent phosphoglycerate mutase